VAVVLAWGIPAAAKELSPAEKEAAELVTKALDAELRGDADERQSLLEQAVKIAPKYAPARWHLGQVQHGGKWSDVDAVAASTSGNEQYAQYRELRKAHSGTPVGELLLARWCHENKLADEEQLHWRALHQLEPANLKAAKALGLQKYHGRWLAPHEIERFKQAEKQFETARDYWKPRLERWAEDIEKRSGETRETALTNLRSVDDVAAIPWLEMLVTRRSAELGQEVVGILGKMKGQPAIGSLVRHALLSQFEEVRKAAIDELKKRPLEAFAGPLVEGLTAPPEVDVDRSLQGAPARSPSFVKMSVWARIETINDVQEIDSTFRGMSFSGSFGVETFLGVSERWALLGKLQELEVINVRICELLQGVTGLDFGRDQKKWWQWWMDYNVQLVCQEKPVRKLNQESYSVIAPQLARGAPVFPLPQKNGPPEARSTTDRPLPPQYLQTRSMFPDQTAYVVNPAWVAAMQPHFSCFAAGTPVHTKMGTAPIEEIRVGDSVLSQDANTGELAFRQVLETTQGPPTRIVALAVDGEQVGCTLGHLFWVSGSGWTMAKDLKQGDRLHSLRGARIVESVREVEEEPAYNLVIADFNSYFVGENALLVHDITSRRPTNTVIPGLVEVEKTALLK